MMPSILSNSWLYTSASMPKSTGSLWPITELNNAHSPFIGSLLNTTTAPDIEGILPKGPYLPCVSMAGRALLAGYHKHEGVDSNNTWIMNDNNSNSAVNFYHTWTNKGLVINIFVTHDWLKQWVFGTKKLCGLMLPYYPSDHQSQIAMKLIEI